MNVRWQLLGAAKRMLCILLVVSVALGALVAVAQQPAATFEKPAADAKPIAIATTSVTTGQKVVTTTHSFNVYVFQTPRGGSADAMSPLARLAKEGGFDGQKQVALQMIGNSTVTQHWNAKGGDDNVIKKALRDGGVDVFTLAPHRQMPEPAIDQFADLACKNNPNIRIMAQMSWSSWDGTSTNGQGFTNDDHNKMTKEDLTGRVAAGVEDYAVRLRGQLAGINQRHGRSIGYVVPVSPAVIQLRVAVLEGKVPGVAKQSDLFSDAMGHPGRNGYLSNMVEYCWYAVMYGKTPVGLKSFVKEGDENSAKIQRLLQDIALDVVTKEPMSGFPKQPAAATAQASAQAK